MEDDMKALNQLGFYVKKKVVRRKEKKGGKVGSPWTLLGFLFQHEVYVCLEEPRMLYQVGDLRSDKNFHWELKKYYGQRRMKLVTQIKI